jgi:adenosylcobinamide-phosphate synthase
VRASVGLVVAFAIDRAFGEPRDAIHPVAWMGRAIAIGRRWALAPSARFGQLLRGACVALVVPTASAAIAYGVAHLTRDSALSAVLATALLLKPMFAVRALRDAAFTVRDALERDDLPAARRGLGSLCSRSAAHLDEPALLAATVESVAENASDSVVAPLFWFACFGLPGAVFYRAANTLDAMMGYHGELEWAGKAAARLDDLLNLVPARLTALLLLAGGAWAGGDVRKGLAILRRDGQRTESPNAGRPMAAMAGLLGVRLEKAGHYALGDEREPIQTAHVTKAWRVVSFASTAALVVTAFVVAVRGG